jgi:hypothetical protein
LIDSATSIDNPSSTVKQFTVRKFSFKYRTLASDFNRENKAMPAQTPEQFLKSIKGPGLVVVRDDLFYFIPLSVMNEHVFPDAFLKGAVGVSKDLFQKVNGDAGVETPSQVFQKMDQHLATFRIADGVSQAIWLDEESGPADKMVSKSAGSKQVFFVYDKDNKKIVVDMSKGGKISDR